MRYFIAFGLIGLAAALCYGCTSKAVDTSSATTATSASSATSSSSTSTTSSAAGGGMSPGVCVFDDGKSTFDGGCTFGP